MPKSSRSRVADSPTAVSPRAARRRRPGRPRGGPGHAIATRERIVQVATELFAQNGYHATGVAEIGLRAGIQRGALYYHIGSKHELLWDVLRGHVEEAAEAAERVERSDLAPAAKLARLIQDHMRTIAKQRAAVAIYARDGAALTGKRGAQLQALRYRVESAWLRVVEEGHRAGVLRTADHVTVNGLLGLVNSIYWWYRPDGADTPEEIAERFAALVLHGLLTAAAPAPAQLTESGRPRSSSRRA